MPTSNQIVVLAIVNSHLGQKKRTDTLQQLQAALRRDIPREVVLYLKTLYILVQKGYFDLPILPVLETTRTLVTGLLDQQQAEKNTTYNSSITRSSTSNNKADWEVLEDREIPPVGDKDYIL